MIRDYADIVKRLGVPLWYDEHGVPRYDPFSPDMLDIYAEQAVLQEIACQECGQRFQVALCFNRMDVIQTLGGQLPVPSPDAPGHYHWGDPPQHGKGAQDRDCGAGDTMNCWDLRIIEFWQRSLGDKWTRMPAHEITWPGEIAALDE